jgi:flavodoxin
MAMRSLLVLYSYHHHNTEKVAKVIARVLDAQIRAPQEIGPEELQAYDLVGFGSGIYSERHHQSLLDLADRMQQAAGGRAFIFSTSGAPSMALKGEQLGVTTQRFHSALRERLRAKGYAVVGEFLCPGLNTNSFLKYFGGLNKGHPDAEDLQHAEEFAQRLKVDTSGP